MAEVRAASGVPAVAAFAGLGAPTLCAPVVVDSATGYVYTLTSGNVVVAAGVGGTVTSVAMTVPSQLSVSGSPITGTGTLAVTWQAQAANRVLSGPATGADAAPTFRALVAADVPTAALTKGDDTNITLTLGGGASTALVNAASITAGWAGTLAVARGGTGSGTAAGARTALGLGTMATQNVGADGSFTTVDLKTVTVANGIITAIT